MLLDIYGDVTIRNGTIAMTNTTESGADIWVNQTAKLTVEKSATISAPSNSFAIAYWKDCTTAEVTFRGKITGGNGITVNGLITGTTTANKLTVDGATINVGGHGIYQAGNATTALNNSAITGATGTEVRAGNLTVTNSTITGNGTFKCKANDNGTTTDGVGIAIAQHTTKLPINVTISGGTISGTYAVYESNPQTNDDDSIAKVKLSITDGNFNGSTAAVYSKDVKNFISGGLFSRTIDNSYCATGLTVISNTDGATMAAYPYTVGTIKANDENKIDAVTTTGTNAVNTDTIQEASKANATTVANQVKLEDSIADKVAITETDKQRGLTALVNENKVNVDATTGKLTDGTTITIIKEIFLDVSVTEFNLQNNDPSIIMDITPMYSLIATTNKDNRTDSNSVKLETKPISVTDATKVSVILPTAFANQKVYITHKNDIYIATADENGKIEFTTNGFSPFTFSLSNSDVVAEVNGNAYKTLQEAADAAKDGEKINIVKNDKLDLNFTDTKSIKVTNKTSDTITVTFNGVNKDVAKGATEAFTYTRPSSGGPGSSGGSISAPTTYAVNVNAATNGAVAADKKTASKGTTVTVTASPSKGYVVDAVKVVDKDGKDVAVTEKDGKYVFTMPASAVTVTGSFKAETPAPVALPFTDVKSGNWFYDAVKYAYAQGLMTGTSATTFAPNGTMNRAMIVTVLYRLEKSPAVTGASKFTDVPAGQWYSDAVAWAAANKIVNGYDETTFGPMNAVTREQMAAILFRYEQVKGLENVTLEENLNRFPDQNKISAYAIPALQWAVGQKIINGNADGTLDPTGTATRAQVAQIFTNLLNK